MLVNFSPAVHTVSDKMPLCCPVKNGHLMFLLVLWLIMSIQKLNPIPLFTGNFSPEGRGLTRTEKELPSCSRKWSARRGAHYLCCAAAGAFVWRGDEREMWVSQGVSQALSSVSFQTEILSGKRTEWVQMSSGEASRSSADKTNQNGMPACHSSERRQALHPQHHFNSLPLSGGMEDLSKK